MKTIKLLFFLLLTSCCCALSTHAQDQKLKVSLQYGLLSTGRMDDKEYGDYTTPIKGRWGWNINADVSYFITKRFFLSLHLSEGSLEYSAEREYRISNAHGENNGVYSIATVGLLAGYRLPLTEWSHLSGQIGFGQFSLLDEYSYTATTPTGNPDHLRETKDGNGYNTTFSASIPVKVAIGFQPFKKMNAGFVRNLEIGYACGLDIEPDFGFFTFFYHGPQLSFSF
jgi:hypothetical protein